MAGGSGGDAGRGLMWRRGPAPGLSGLVLRYTAFEQRAPAPVAFRELPCTYVPAILDLGEGWRIADGRRPQRAPERLGSFVAGLTDGPVLVEHPGSARCVQVDLSPAGARRLLGGLPMHELANRPVPLADVLGPAGDALVERLGAARGWPERLELLDRALLARLAAPPPAAPAVAWALGRLAAARGRPSIGDIARELGWSHRRLIARFREEVGLPPAAVARILRLERLLAAIRAEPRLGWAPAAAACGYADQAHMARDVRRLTGLTPTALRAERVTSAHDPVDAPP